MRYSDIVVDGAKTVASLRGLAEMPIDGFELSNVRAKSVTRGVEATNVDDAYLKNVSIDADEAPAFDIERAAGLELDRVGDPAPDPDEPVVRLSDVDAVVRSCTPPAGDGPFLEYGDDDAVRTPADRLSRAEREPSASE